MVSKNSLRQRQTAGLVDKQNHILHSGPIVASYPTRSLEFLRELEQRTEQDAIADVERSTCPLNILIVGAGIGGLATAIALGRRGHTVAILEQSPELTEVGAGIQVPPNSTRLLLRWGLEPFLKGRTVSPGQGTLRRWQNGEPIGYRKVMPEYQDVFRAPYFVIHRADYQRALYDRALELGVVVKFGCRIERYDAEKPSMVTQDGVEHSADLIIAADGIFSEARKEILKEQDMPPLLSGFAAYRATVPASKVREDPDTAWLLQTPGQNCWLGPSRHVVVYLIEGGKSVNVVMIHPEDSDPSTWKQEAALEDMRRQYAGWDHRLTKLIGKVDQTLKWPMMTGQQLDRWVSDSNKLVILGDAAHAMLPFMAQGECSRLLLGRSAKLTHLTGAAMAVEDAASIATLLSSISTPSEIPAALRVFQQLRIPRASQMQEASFINGRLWHFPDGPMQRARDAALRPEVEGRHYMQSPNQQSDPVTAAWCVGHDAEEEARKAWESEAL